MSEKIIFAKFVPKKEENNVIWSEHYLATCPFCKKENHGWVSEVESGNSTGNSKCEHFVSHGIFIKDPIFLFRDTILIKCLPTTEETVVIKTRWIEIEGEKFNFDRLVSFLDSIKSCSLMDEFQNINSELSNRLVKKGFMSQTSNGCVALNDKGFALYDILVKEYEKAVKID